MNSKSVTFLSSLALFCGCDYYNDNINGYVYDIFSSPVIANNSNQNFELYLSSDTILPLEIGWWETLYCIEDSSVIDSLSFHTHCYSNVDIGEEPDLYVLSLFLFHTDTLRKHDWLTIRSQNMVEKRIDINYANRFDTIVIE